MPKTDVVSVFAAGPGGGNRVPIITDAAHLTDRGMQDIAVEHGMEIGVVMDPARGSKADLAMRYWVPRHEMSMCGHATIGAVWVLCQTGALAPGSVTIDTEAGLVYATVTNLWDPAAAIESPSRAGG